MGNHTHLQIKLKHICSVTLYETVVVERTVKLLIYRPQGLANGQTNEVAGIGSPE